MRRSVRLSIAAVLCAAAAVPLTGCGAEKAAGVDIAEAAQTTKRQGTARMTMTMRVTGMGLPEPLTMRAEGVTALASPQAEIDVDFGSMLEQFGVDDKEPVKVRVDGAQVYAKPPKLSGLDIPASGWIALDLRALITALGVDADALGALFTIDPATQLKAIRAAKDLQQMGTEEIEGARTQHYEGTLRLSDYIASLPAEQQAPIKGAIAQLDRVSGSTSAADSIDAPTPTELWIDDEGNVRRMRQTSTMPAQQGVPRGSMLMTCELSEFGAELDVSRPEGTVDVTRSITEALSSQQPQLGSSQR